MDIALHPLGNPIGTEVRGIDLSEETSAEINRWILRELAQHCVLVFRNQKLDAAGLTSLGQRLGEPRPHILLKYRHPQYPNVSYLTNVDADRKVDPFGVTRAAVWHSDMTYRNERPHLAMLHALEVPREKGGTMFCDMRAAYDALPDALRTRLDHLTAIHEDATGPQGYRRGKTGSNDTHEPGHNEARHPAVLVHPISGRRTLFVNPMHTVGFEGVDDNEGCSLIEELAAHATQDRFVYYHQWRPGDLLMWDEASTMHRNAGDHQPTDRRVFLRTIVFNSDIFQSRF